MTHLNSIETTRSWLLKKGVPTNEIDIIVTEQEKRIGFTSGIPTTIYRRYHNKYTEPEEFEEMYRDGWVVDIVDGQVVYGTIDVKDIPKIIESYKKIQQYCLEYGKTYNSV